MNVLWLCPTLNHYKVKNLDYFNENYDVNVTVIAGSGRKGMGDATFRISSNMRIINLDVLKSNFGFSLKVFREILKEYKNFDWIHISRERKFFLQIILFFFIKKLNRHPIKIFTYCHPKFSQSKKKIVIAYNNILTNFINLFYDKIIFYNKKGMESALSEGLVTSTKANYSNNTIFTTDIESFYKLSYPLKSNLEILYIGRLIENKKLHLLVEYFKILKKIAFDLELCLKLNIIGDGPLLRYLKNEFRTENNVIFLGAVISEKKISQYMINSKLVFVPGHAGLAINHAFCYGRPFVTIDSDDHPPEISYLKNDYNGLLLKGNIEKDTLKLYNFIKNDDLSIYDNAYKTGLELSTKKWCDKIKNSLIQ